MFTNINEGILPTYNKDKVCMEFYSNADIRIEAGETGVVQLGVKLDVDKWYKKHKSSGNLTLNYYNATKLKDFKNTYCLEMLLNSSLEDGLVTSNGVSIVSLNTIDELFIRIYNPITVVGCNGGIWGATKNKGNLSEAYYIKKGTKIAEARLKEYVTHYLVD